jgi:endonuclease/exonuclease/phosphatase family metal-dependent hydrolase
MEKLRQRIERVVPRESPLIVAGDFNDWRQRATHELAHPLDLHEVFELVRGRPARTFPATWPFMTLDRIYVRGFRVPAAHVHHGRAWARISDHAPITASLVPL